MELVVELTTKITENKFHVRELKFDSDDITNIITKYIEDHHSLESESIGEIKFVLK